MASVRLCFLLVISGLPTFCDNRGVFDKIKDGLRNAQGYLKTVKDIANLVSKSLNQKETQKRGDDSGINKEKEKPKGSFGSVSFISTFFRLLGLDSQKITAITVNSVIFLAQMIGSLFDLTPRIDTTKSDEQDELPDPYKFFVENNDEKIQNLVKEAQDETLPEKLIEKFDGLDTSCIRLLICKTKPIINAAQISLQNKYSNPFREITSWLPSIEQFEDNSEVCEQNHTDCLLFPPR